MITATVCSAVNRGRPRPTGCWRRLLTWMSCAPTNRRPPLKPARCAPKCRRWSVKSSFCVTRKITILNTTTGSSWKPCWWNWLWPQGDTMQCRDGLKRRKPDTGQGLGRLILSVVIVSAALLSGQVQAQTFTPPTALESLERGQQLLMRGSYLAAIEAFNNVRDEFYQNQVALGISRAQQETGQYEAAIATLRDQIDTEVDSPQLATRLAELYVITGRSADALAILERLVSEQLEPSVRTLVQYGQVLTLRGERGQATQQFNAALARYDSGRVFSSDDVGMVALAAWGVDEFHDANALFSEAVRLDSNNIEALVHWGDLFQE